ncbi:cytochrome P450 [Actinomadura sp. ATCC 31491]|uniref:Cytochrome P450 n=1 Tax=Actinomadura luzonensis TaxID=2805427 RepID=A0ABT0FV07_9ACTN|nr:cytochrome P450 [Actinomadura luzonensis]MCK2216170.1 cytochrome P450 [Actinomadura luzonensis]UKU09921.1 Luz20 [Actinomadura luzonensis]
MSPSLDLTDPAAFVRTDPHAFWREVRREHPVYWHEPSGGRPGFWVVSRYADVLACYDDWKRLSSARGTVLDVLLRGGDSAGGKMLAVTDRPRHRHLRNLMLQAFSPRRLGEVAAKVEARTARLVAAVTELGRFDFAAEVAEHIPMNTICDLLSIPEQDRKELLQWSKSALSSERPDSAELDSLEARNEIVLYLMDLAFERRARPGDDVISMIAGAEVEGRPLTPEEIALNCYSLLLGGDESSRMSGIAAVLAFARDPGEWRRLREGAVGLDTAVEEILRWATPGMHFARTALTDLTLGGQRVRAGDIVTLWNTSANNDETVFPGPRVLDLGRRPNKHLTFGHGPHFCVGAFLGRTELRALLESLVACVGTIELDGTPARIYSNFLYGHSSLPVRFLPRAQA